VRYICNPLNLSQGFAVIMKDGEYTAIIACKTAEDAHKCLYNWQNLVKITSSEIRFFWKNEGLGTI
jgi:hypothetical protein